MGPNRVMLLYKNGPYAPSRIRLPGILRGFQQRTEFCVATGVDVGIQDKIILFCEDTIQPDGVDVES